MLKIKCPRCDKKIEKKFSFCPYCGLNVARVVEQEDFGMIGKDDFVKEIEQEIKMPIGLDKIFNSLIKNLDKQMGGGMNGNPGFKIQISTGPKPERQEIAKKIPMESISEKDIEKRRNLPRTEAESSVRRLSDRIVYEIFVPGVKTKKDIVISKMESGVEIKAYSKDKCFYKVIPIKVDLLGYHLEDDILFLELKN